MVAEMEYQTRDPKAKDRICVWESSYWLIVISLVNVHGKQTGFELVQGWKNSVLQEWEESNFTRWLTQTAALVLSAGTWRLDHINHHINSSLLQQFVGKYFDHSAYGHSISFKCTIWNSFHYKIEITTKGLDGKILLFWDLFSWQTKGSFREIRFKCNLNVPWCNEVQHGAYLASKMQQGLK